MRLYHRTSPEAAAAIVRDGFRDTTDDYGFRDAAGEVLPLTGVWLSDVPLDEQEGAFGDTLLLVTLDAAESVLSEYEVVEEGKAYREWCVPAAMLSQLTSKIQIEEPERLGHQATARSAGRVRGRSEPFTNPR